MNKKRLLIISFSYVDIDTRVSRQITTFSEKFNITVLSYGNTKNHIFEHIEVPRKNFLNKITSTFFLLLRKFEKSYWNTTEIKYIQKLENLGAYDLIFCNEIDTLPVANKLFPNCPIYLDLHEYSPLELETSIIWKILFKKYKYYLCRKYLYSAGVISTVSETISKKYMNEFKLGKVHVIRNTPMYEDFNVKKIDNQIKILFHGAASPERQIIKLVRILRKLDSRFIVDLYLYKNKYWYILVIKLITQFSQITVLEPIPMKLLSKNANQYDMGLIVYNNKNFNVSAAMPNKLFEYIQGRVGLIVGSSLSLKQFVQKNKIGIYSEREDNKDLIRKINEMTLDDVMSYKKSCDELASVYCWDVEQKRLISCIEYLLNK